VRELPSFRECFSFPLSTPEARRDVWTGGLVLLALLPIGWVLNLGHRLDVVYRVCHREPPYFRGFAPWTATFRRGLTAFVAIALYLSPSIAFAAATHLFAAEGQGIDAAVSNPGSWSPGAASIACAVASLATFAIAIYALPGGMTYNAAYGDISYLYRPDKAIRRAIDGGKAYAWAWLIAATAMLLSLAGLVAFGVGFFFTSVWAWSVVGYAFSKALALGDDPTG